MFKTLMAVLALFFTCFFAPFAFAANQQKFTASYDVLYDVSENGVTAVTEKINLKNLTPEYYANQFKLTIGATDVFDIKAQDPGGTLAVGSEQKDNLTLVNVKFNQQVTGLGKSLAWTISFKSKDFVQNLGKVWEVRIPKISADTNPESYNLTLAVPQSFGEPALITPAPRTQSDSGGKILLTFDAGQLTTAGVSASFGNHQLFNFSLAYHLQSHNLLPVLTKITLPPDTSYQDVVFNQIDPKPISVTVDDDGNYLAWYRLSRNQKLDIIVSGSARLYVNSKARHPSLEKSLKDLYTKSDRYWEKNNPQIAARLNEILNQPSGQAAVLTISEKAERIFQFVVNYLNYHPAGFSDTDRLGAAAALNNPQSAGSREFTDLFIAIARAAGIPSRELNGFAYSNNTKLRPLIGNTFHVWPEYYDDKHGWVMVDPVWQNTTGGVDYFNKLDLNHFVFAVRGLSSESPVPAGFSDSSDVKVTLADKDFLGTPKIDASIDTPNPILSGFPGMLKVKITNTGNAFYPSSSLSITANNLMILNGNIQQTGVIPAYGASEFNFNIRTKSLLDSYDDQITVTINGRQFTKPVSIKSLASFWPGPLILMIATALMALTYLATLGTLIYRKRIRLRKKRGQ